MSALEHFRYKIINSDDRDVRFEIHTKCGRYRSQFLLYPQHGIARLIIHLDFLFLASRMTWLSEFVHRLNQSSAILSTFLMDHDGGGISLHRGIEYEAGKISPPQFIHALNRSAHPLHVFESAVPFLENPGKATPKTVIASALLLSGSADENTYLSKSAKKPAFKLIQ